MSFSVTRRVIASLVLALPAAGAFAATHNVTVGGAGLTFSPASITIPQGDTVTFTNAGGFHNAVSDDAGVTFSSGAADGSGWTFTTPPLNATVGYHCTVHGSVGGGMFGTINVVIPVQLQSFEVD
jgi:plastocyanin